MCTKYSYRLIRETFDFRFFIIPRGIFIYIVDSASLLFFIRDAMEIRIRRHFENVNFIRSSIRQLAAKREVVVEKKSGQKSN